MENHKVTIENREITTISDIVEIDSQRNKHEHTETGSTDRRSRDRRDNKFTDVCQGQGERRKKSPG